MTLSMKWTQIYFNLFSGGVILPFIWHAVIATLKWLYIWWRTHLSGLTSRTKLATPPSKKGRKKKWFHPSLNPPAPRTLFLRGKYKFKAELFFWTIKMVLNLSELICCWVLCVNYPVDNFSRQINYKFSFRAGNLKIILSDKEVLEWFMLLTTLRL